MLNLRYAIFLPRLSFHSSLARKRHLGVLFPSGFSYPGCPATETIGDQVWGGFGSVACGHARREPEMRMPPGTWVASTLVRALGLAYPWPAHCLAPRALGQESPHPALETPVSPRGSFPGLDSPLVQSSRVHSLSSSSSWRLTSALPLEWPLLCDQGRCPSTAC